MFTVIRKLVKQKEFWISTGLFVFTLVVEAWDSDDDSNE